MTTVLEATPVEDTARTWKIKAEVRKYLEADVDVRVERRRVGKGLRSVCRRRARVTIATPKPGCRPYEVVVDHHNLLVNAGIQRLEDLLIGAGGQAYDSTHSRIGVGDDTTAAAATQTDLQAGAGSTHRQFKLNSTPPARSSQTITIIATFASGEGNFAWQEWCVDVGTADGTTIVTPMLNRKVASLGTKVSGNVWTFTITLVIS